MIATHEGRSHTGRIIVIVVVTLILLAFLAIFWSWFKGRDATLAPRQGPPADVDPSSSPVGIE